MKMQTKKVRLSKNAASGWSYEDDDFWKSNMNLLEAASMFIARLAASLQHLDDKREDVKIEIVLKKY